MKPTNADAAEEAWERAGFSHEDAADWRDAGFTLEQALVWSSPWECADQYPHQARAIEPVGETRRYAFTASEAARWVDEEYSYEEARDWIERGHVRYGECGIQVEDGLIMSATVHWRVPDVTPAEAAKWRDLGFDTDEGPAWRSLVFTPEEAVFWRIAGFCGPDDATEWVFAFGTDGGAEALAWINAGWHDVRDAAGWSRYFTPKEACAWREKVFDPVEANQLRGSGLTPEDLTGSRPDEKP